jgi:hypothetical protein
MIIIIRSKLGHALDRLEINIIQRCKIGKKRMCYKRNPGNLQLGSQYHYPIAILSINTDFFIVGAHHIPAMSGAINPALDNTFIGHSGRYTTAVSAGMVQFLTGCYIEGVPFGRYGQLIIPRQRMSSGYLSATTFATIVSELVNLLKDLFGKSIGTGRRRGFHATLFFFGGVVLLGVTSG